MAIADWVQRQLAKAPPWSDEQFEEVQKLLCPPAPPEEFMHWRVRLYCGHICEVTRLRRHERPDGGVTDKERCAECGLNPSVIVAFEPLVSG
ncbi:hypothetical protein [Streptomyces sp. NPDC090083]|uniref:hypothetical protein n=1 Tax=Streptomyces sp. NPDC090083 TaxID=3365941 RepID=UPI003806B707